MEMIERVAKAICKAAGIDCPASLLSMHENMARAAIEAMREPTEAMIWAGYAAGKSYESVPDDFRDAWPAMIDAALLQPPSSDR